jgi:hypothetical protein
VLESDLVVLLSVGVLGHTSDSGSFVDKASRARGLAVTLPARSPDSGVPAREAQAPLQ